MATTDDYYDQAPHANVYYGDPYYGSVNTIIVERDPYTGRYYQVSPGYGTGVYGAPAYGYGRRQQHYGGGRYYNNNNRNYNNNRNNSNNRNYNSNTNGNGYYKNYPQRQQQAQPPRQAPVQQQQQPRPQTQQRNEAKDAILGRPRS
jgi:hypothetical protein